MPTATDAPRTALLKNSLRKSTYLAAAAALSLWPSIASAVDPTNTATGNGALASVTSGAGNTADGYYALHANTTGGYNIAVGHDALVANTGGSENVGIGLEALFNNTTGSNNIAAGAYSLFGNTTGQNNTASGFSALTSNNTGSANVAVGYSALLVLASGGSNIALGANAGKNLTGGSRNIYIGHNGAASESNVTRIGQLQTKTFIAGIAGVPLSGATVVVTSTGQLGVVASSARYKTDIHDLRDASDRLGQLHPVSYQYKTEPGVTHFGLIAEEVDKVMPELVVHDEQNRPETVQYQELIPLLLQQVKQLKAEVAELRRTRLADTAAAR